MVGEHILVPFPVNRGGVGGDCALFLLLLVQTSPSGSPQKCETYEKCCPNVCGTKSCVAARYMDVKGKKGARGHAQGGHMRTFHVSAAGL